LVLAKKVLRRAALRNLRPIKPRAAVVKRYSRVFIFKDL
jgi:hypothetical protein